MRKNDSALPTRAAERFADILVAADDAGGVGFVAAQLPIEGQVLWVQERMAALEAGRPVGGAQERFGNRGEHFLFACARNAADVLWTMEEGLKCAALSGVVGEFWGDPGALDFTATKRLALRAERRRIPVFLIRFGGSAVLSAARERWRISSLSSLPHPWDPRAPGEPRWRAELFRARHRPPGLWEARYDSAAHRLDFLPAFPDPEVEAPQHTGRKRAAGDRSGG